MFVFTLIYIVLKEKMSTKLKIKYLYVTDKVFKLFKAKNVICLDTF